MPTTRSESERNLQFIKAFRGPFRFLDLPFELRVYVYKALFAESVLHIRWHPYKRKNYSPKPMVDCSDFQSALTKTCRLIRYESRVLLAQSTRLYVERGLDDKIPDLIGLELRQHLGHLSLFPVRLSSTNHLGLVGLESLKTLMLWVESDHSACRSNHIKPLARVCKSRMVSFLRDLRDKSSLLEGAPQPKVTLHMHFSPKHGLRGLWAESMRERCLVCLGL